MILPVLLKDELLKLKSSSELNKVFSSFYKNMIIDLYEFSIKKLIELVELINGKPFSEDIFYQITHALMKYYNFNNRNSDFNKKNKITDKEYECVRLSIEKTNVNFSDKINEYSESLTLINNFNVIYLPHCKSYANYISEMVKKRLSVVYKNDSNRIFKVVSNIQSQKNSEGNVVLFVYSDQLSYDVFLCYFISYYYDFFEEDSIKTLYGLIKNKEEEYVKIIIEKLIDRAIISGNRIQIEDIYSVVGVYQSQYDIEIIGQDNAIREATEIIEIRKIMRINKQKPEAVLFFVGPTGVGKTELAKKLAHEYKDGYYTIINCENFSTEHSVMNLLGSPLSYIGSDSEPLLLSDMRTNPSRIVIFDEIEKAHRNFFNILLGMLDSGFLVFNGIKKISFRDTIVVFTSNALSKISLKTSKSIGFTNNEQPSEANRDTSVYNILTRMFLPEFLGRLDRIIIFEQIKEKDTIIRIIKEKIELMLENLTIHHDDSDYNNIYENVKSKVNLYGVRAIITEVEKYFVKKINKQLNV